MTSYLTLIIIAVVALVIFTIMMRQGAFLKLSAYWVETLDELRKCTWPTWDELMGSTTVVIVAVCILGGFTVVVDLAMTKIIRFIV